MRVHSFSPLPVGVVYFRCPEPMVAVVVKATYALPRDPSPNAICSLAPHQEPVSVERPSRFADDSPDEADYASDFVPRKARVDVTISGHAYAAARSTCIPCALTVGEATKELFALAPNGATTVPLHGDAIVDRRGVRTQVTPTRPRAAYGPMQAPRSAIEAAHSPEWMDLAEGGPAAYQSAPPDQQLWQFVLPARIRAVNLTRGGGARGGVIPNAAPVLFEWRAGQPFAAAERIALRCDSIHVDTDDETVSLTFRGEMPVRAEPSRLVSCFAFPNELPRLDVLASYLPSANVFDADTAGSGEDFGRETIGIGGAPMRSPALPFAGQVGASVGSGGGRSRDEAAETTAVFAAPTPPPEPVAAESTSDDTRDDTPVNPTLTMAAVPANLAALPFDLGEIPRAAAALATSSPPLDPPWAPVAATSTVATPSSERPLAASAPAGGPAAPGALPMQSVVELLMATWRAPAKRRELLRKSDLDEARWRLVLSQFARDLDDAARSGDGRLTGAITALEARSRG